jgi:glycosyltransferase involved in cell wall biosynthesis
LNFAKKEGYEILHSHGYKFNILLGLMPRIIRKIPLITTMHGYVTAKNNSKLWLYRKIESFVLKNLSGIVFVSDELKQLPLLEKLTFKNQATIYNGINKDYVIAKSSEENSPSTNDIFPNKKKGQIILGAIGRLSKEKGFGLLIDVFNDLSKSHSNLLLVIIGEGELRKELEQRINELELSEKVVLPGFINPLHRIMSELDVIIMPSLSEGMPITLLEACVLGKKIVASRVGGIPNVLAEYPCAEMVESADPTALRNAVDRAVGEMLDKHSVMTCDLSDKFTSKKMSSGYENFYNKMIGTN